MSYLDSAIEEYMRALSAFKPGQKPYTEVEFPKLKIANAVLLEMGLPLSPPDQTLEKRKVDTGSSNRSGFVYLMRNERNGFCKIGFSTKPKKRERTLQSEEPEIRLLISHVGTMADEFILHKKFESKRVRGEWFLLNEADIDEFASFFFKKETEQ